MNDHDLPKRYQRSNALLKRAKNVIPLGSQTFSKSFTQYPENYAPLYITRGCGGRVWDVDGNEYVDLICGLLPVVIGYCDQEINDSIIKQLRSGITFSLATELEIELAELLTKIIPSAEMVRFCKNGSDATSGCVRIARAVTGRSRIAAGGYHGWQDWYIGSTVRNKGIPSEVSKLTHKFNFYDLSDLERLLNQYQNQFAAVIVEPVGFAEVTTAHLQKIKNLAHKHGCVLIFDEVIAGFRAALGGAQELYGVTPDLSSFGKSMGNGMPISAIVGKADLMNQMEDIFFSSTFGGETLSIAAAIATITKLKRDSGIKKIWNTGALLKNKVDDLILRFELGTVFKIGGIPPWTILNFQDSFGSISKEAIKTRFMIEMLKNGILVSGSHNICMAHDDRDVSVVVDAYSRCFRIIAEQIEARSLEKLLPCDPIYPVFTIRN